MLLNLTRLSAVLLVVFLSHSTNGVVDDFCLGIQACDGGSSCTQTGSERYTNYAKSGGMSIKSMKTYSILGEAPHTYRRLDCVGRYALSEMDASHCTLIIQGDEDYYDPDGVRIG